MGLELRFARVKVRFGIGGLVLGLTLRVDHGLFWGCVYGYRRFKRKRSRNPHPNICK